MSRNLTIGVPERLIGGSSRCEARDPGARRDTACGARATYWDGYRLVCPDHRPEGAEA